MRISDWSSDVCSSDLISGLYGCVFWLPQIIGKLSSGIGADLATWLSIVPFAVGTCALLLNATHSDRVQERGRHLIGGFLVGGGGLLAAGLISNPWLAFAGLTIGRSEEHTSELLSLMRISSAVFCLTNKHRNHFTHSITYTIPLYIR